MVTPFAGVWIEIRGKEELKKYKRVTPFAGVWIEIFPVIVAVLLLYSHSLRGSVD